MHLGLYDFQMYGFCGLVGVFPTGNTVNLHNHVFPGGGEGGGGGGGGG